MSDILQETCLGRRRLQCHDSIGFLANRYDQETLSASTTNAYCSHLRHNYILLRKTVEAHLPSCGNQDSALRTLDGLESDMFYDYWHMPELFFLSFRLSPALVFDSYPKDSVSIAWSTSLGLRFTFIIPFNL